MLTGERRQQVIGRQLSQSSVTTGRRHSPDTKKVWLILDPKHQPIVIALTIIMTLRSMVCYKPNMLGEDMATTSYKGRHVSNLYDVNRLDEGDKLAKLSGDDITVDEPVNNERRDQDFPADLIRSTTSSSSTTVRPSARYSAIQFDDETEEQEEGDEEFFTKNPVDQKSTNDSLDYVKEVEVNDLDFNDFYDHAYKSAFKFDDDDQKANASNKKRRSPHRNKIKIDSGREHKTSASVETLGANVNGALECATVLARGTCLTYGLIEWAIRAARRWLSYSRPAGLGSLEPRESTINSVGELVEFTTRVLAGRLQLTAEEIGLELESIDMSRTSLWFECPRLFRAPPRCLLGARYRTHTGQCNNPFGTHLGSSNMPFVRSLPAHYDDGIGLARMSSVASGLALPSARLVALNLHPNIESPSEERSALFMSWGQLLNHDLALASGARPATGHGRPCCFGNNRGRERTCLPIGLGPDDPVYAPLGVTCHEFKRSLAGLRPGCSLGARTQVNTITSFIDASFVYGSSRSVMRSLRSGARRGSLAMWNYFGGGGGLKPLLPPQRANPDEECVNRRGRLCFLSGDARTNQQVQLVVLHTIHARQHNRLAGALAQLNPHWPSERLYQEARHIHIALVQHILLAEYLPSLLGPKLCARHNLTEAPAGHHWDHYDPGLNPGVSQSFAAAAFRQGHSTVPSQVFRFSHQHEPVRAYQLRHLFRQPWALFEPWALDQFLLGLVDAPAQQLDPFVSEELSGHLLQMPGELLGLDLAAINIQRGRDQGLPPYNAFRDWCGLGRASTFGELEGLMSNASLQLMSALYEHVDDIDLFSGGLSEFPAEGAQLGPTFACIIGRQFSAVRAGDRYWFESSLGPHAFTPAQLDSIRQVSLARLVCANSDGILTIQRLALQVPHPVLNPRLDCRSLPDLDIGLWFEPRPAPLS